MAGWTQGWTCAAAIAALALVPNLIATGELSASATVSPTSGYAGAKLVATYSFTVKSSCSAYHNDVLWSFGNTMNWATSPVASSTGTNCISSTPSTAPPSGDAPGLYMVCGTDTSVTSMPACTTYTITPPIRTPTPSPKPSPRTSPSPSPNSSTGIGAIGETPSPTASPGAPPPAGNGGGGSSTFQAADRAGTIPVWPWTLLLFLLVVMAAAWRFRSWLMGVLENVVVLGRSGADLETQLLHHQPSPLPTGATYTSTALPPGSGGGTMVNQSGGDTTFDEPEGWGAEATLPAEVESPPDRSANFETEAIDAQADPPPES